jgi:hypothetical protein
MRYQLAYKSPSSTTRRWHGWPVVALVVGTIVHYGISLWFLETLYDTCRDWYMPGRADSRFALYLHVFEFPMTSDGFLRSNAHVMLGSREVFASYALINAIAWGAASGVVVWLAMVAVRAARSVMSRDTAYEK